MVFKVGDCAASVHNVDHKTRPLLTTDLGDTMVVVDVAESLVRSQVVIDHHGQVCAQIDAVGDRVVENEHTSSVSLETRDDLQSVFARGGRGDRNGIVAVAFECLGNILGLKHAIHIDDHLFEQRVLQYLEQRLVVWSFTAAPHVKLQNVSRQVFLGKVVEPDQIRIDMVSYEPRNSAAEAGRNVHTLTVAAQLVLDRQDAHQIFAAGGQPVEIVKDHETHKLCI